MATFTRKTSRNIGLTPTKVGSYNATGSSVMLSLVVCNTSNSSITADVYHSDGSNNTYLAKYVTLAKGAQAQINKAVLASGDSVYVVSTLANSVDAYMNIMEDS